jgi:hypothetical protein
MTCRRVDRRTKTDASLTAVLFLPSHRVVEAPPVHVDPNAIVNPSQQRAHSERRIRSALRRQERAITASLTLWAPRGPRFRGTSPAIPCAVNESSPDRALPSQPRQT